MTIWPWKSAAQAAIPAGIRVYAIGDIHGQAALLDELLGMIERDGMGRPETKVLVFIGDYVDRGTDSKGVIEQLVNLQSDFTAHFLRGNHDQALLDFLANPNSFPLWKDYGAEETLASYGVASPASDEEAALRQTRDSLRGALPTQHLRFSSANARFVAESPSRPPSAVLRDAQAL